MKTNIYKIILPCLFSLLLIVGCEEQNSFIHQIQQVDGIENAVISYQSSDSIVATSELEPAEMTVKRVNNLTNIGIQTGAGQLTIFSEIPEKYINMDADIEIGRDVFMDYFPEEWSDLKKAHYTSIHIRSKTDRDLFFTAVVYTNTATEIGRHSEDRN